MTVFLGLLLALAWFAWRTHRKRASIAQGGGMLDRTYNGLVRRKRFRLTRSPFDSDGTL